MLKISKTIVVFYTGYEILYFVKNGDLSRFNNLFVTDTSDSELQRDLLNIVYDEWGEYKEQMLVDFPIDILKKEDNISVATVVFNDF